MFCRCLSCALLLVKGNGSICRYLLRFLFAHNCFTVPLIKCPILIPIPDINLKEWKTYSSRQRTNIILRIIQSIGFIAIILLSLAFVAQGIISIGAFAAIFSSIDALFSTMNEAVLRQFGTISEELASVKNYLNFMSIDIENKEVKETGVCEKLSNVSFSYPNSEQKVLKDISLTIQEGGTLAIVGENGSGKTTLTKLIMGLYEPTEGTIIRDENRKGITSIFQNHFNYAMTLKQNIKISSKDDKNENLERAISYSDINSNERVFPEGMNTFMGKEFGGIDLSGGEWQKVAIARGIYRDFDMIVFDEPTSAIDPVEESNMYRNIRNVTLGKTAVIVTHRITSVKFADKIAVMKSGRILEYGTHSQLMQLGNEYKRLYASQSENYV